MIPQGRATLDAIDLTLADEAATVALGGAMASVLHRLEGTIAEQGLAAGLSGDLGAGKTALVRAMLRHLGVPGAVKSPSFALLEPYDLSRLHFYHFDFYRFKRPEEFSERGFGEFFAPGAVCFVEWPERAGDDLPRLDLRIALRVMPGLARNGDKEPCRQAAITAYSGLGLQWIELLRNQTV